MKLIKACSSLKYVLNRKAHLPTFPESRQMRNGRVFVSYARCQKSQDFSLIGHVLSDVQFGEKYSTIEIYCHLLDMW